MHVRPKNLDSPFIYYNIVTILPDCATGGVAQVVERSLSMWEARGSIPCISKTLNFRTISYIFFSRQKRECSCLDERMYSRLNNKRRTAKTKGKRRGSHSSLCWNVYSARKRFVLHVIRAFSAFKIAAITLWSMLLKYIIAKKASTGEIGRTV